MQPSEARRLKQLEDENAKLKRLVAELTLDKTILQDVVRKKDGKARRPARSRPLPATALPGERAAGLPVDRVLTRHVAL